jgi:hypothetical protein
MPRGRPKKSETVLPNTPTTEVIVEDKPIEFIQPKKRVPKVKSVIPPVMLRRANDPAPEDVGHFIQTSIDYPDNKRLIELHNYDKKQITKISMLFEFDNDHKNVKTINLI